MPATMFMPARLCMTGHHRTFVPKEQRLETARRVLLRTGIFG